MKDEEKNLIENLFHRLKKAESKTSERDVLADELIQNLVKKQPASSYYMTQTILIQETAIKKMDMKIQELKTKIKSLNKEESNKKTSFLSNFFKRKPSSQTVSNNNAWTRKEDVSHPNYSNAAVLPTTQSSPVVNSSRSSSFLGSALQTATGVAGGMILGNMLMNVFSHSKPEEEMFDTVNKSSSDNYREENFLNNHNDYSDHYDHHDLINYEYDEESDIHENDQLSSSTAAINDDICNTDEIDDDNFI